MQVVGKERRTGSAWLRLRSGERLVSAWAHRSGAAILEQDQDSRVDTQVYDDGEVLCNESV